MSGHDTDPQRTFMAKQAGVEPDADWDTIHAAMHAKLVATTAKLQEAASPELACVPSDEEMYRIFTNGTDEEQTELTTALRVLVSRIRAWRPL